MFNTKEQLTTTVGVSDFKKEIKTKKKLKQSLTAYDACAIVEGFDGEEHSATDIINAWQFLIDTGECWSLQGFYGRTASALIQNGTCKAAKQRGKQ